MEVTLTTTGGVFSAKAPYVGAAYVEVDGWACACGLNKIHGTGERIESRDTYASEAVCADIKCRKRAGTLRIKVVTLFGIEEDEAVLNGPWRVY